MVQLTRKRSILAKIEGTYGTDPVPTGAANAILVRNLNINPLAATVVGRALIRPFLGEVDHLNANTHVGIDMEVEVTGAGTAGTAPAYGPLLRACGLSETILAAPLTGTATAGSTNTITLAGGASATDNVYVGLVCSITGGTGSGQSATIQSYNGTTKVATFSSTLGVALTSSSVYSIGAGVTYKPISEAFESVTIYFNSDGVFHKITGARGTVEITIAAKTIPIYKFKFTGIYNTVTDTAIPTNTYTAFQAPVISNNTNTTGFTFFGVSTLVLESFMLNVNNTIDYRQLIGNEYVQLTNRNSAADITFEAVAVATLDVFSISQLGTTGILSLTQGTVSGNKVKIDCSKIDLSNPTYADNGGVNMVKSPLFVLPTSGNDEFSIAVL